MRIFNKIVVVILLVLLIVFSIIVVVNKFLDLFLWSAVLERLVGSLASVNIFILAAGFVVLIAIAVLLLVLEFRRSGFRLAKISEDMTGKDMMTAKTVSRELEQELQKIVESVENKVKISPRKEGIDIDIFSKLSRGTDVTAITQQIKEKAFDYAKEKLGLTVIETNIVITGFVDKKTS